MADETDHMSGSIGSIISVNCGDGGYYQGRLAAFSPTRKTITLARPLKDGRPLGYEVELSATQIKALKVIKTAGGNTHSTSTSTSQSTPQPTPQSTPRPVSQSATQSTPQAVVLPLTKKPIELSDLEASYLKPAIKSAEKVRLNKSQGDQSHTPGRQSDKRQARFDDNDKQQQQPWVSRPLGGTRRRRRSEDPTCSSARSSPTNDEDEETMGIAPTPIFRKYDPQVAVPTTLETRSMRYSNRSKRNAGPSGIPSLDAARGRVTGKTSELNQPLDMDLLDTDFDFERNLKLFSKETDNDDDFYETVEKPKMSANFAHYENIIDDPSRCTSWTNMVSKNAYSEYESEAAEETPRERRLSGVPSSGKKASPPQKNERRRSSISKRIVVSSFVEVEEGLKLPVLDEKEKARLAKETRSFLGDDAYSLILADRVLEWMFNVIASKEILVERVALLCADSTAQSLLDRILMQLSARGCRVSLYGANLEKALPLVELVGSERDLPSDVQMIVDLDPSMQRKSRSAELTRWIDTLKEAHVICLDHVCPGVSDNERVHALMVGALSTSVMEMMRKASMVVPKVGPTSVAELFGGLSVSKQSRPHIGLADLGVPFAWFGDEAANALSNLFATTFVAPCNLK